MLANFSSTALTRGEMKQVIGGTKVCSCSKKGGEISYMTSGDDCGSPTAGLAYYEFTKNGVRYSGYVESYRAARTCGFKSKPGMV